MPTSTKEPALRQWAYFPRLSGLQTSLASPQTFRLLLESSAGRLVIANIRLRMEPDQALAEGLARLIDEPAFAMISSARIQGEFEARHGHTLELLEVDLDRDDPLPVTGVIPRTLAEAARSRGDESRAVLSLSALRRDISQRLNAEWEAVRTQFIAGLDPESVAQARASGVLTPAGYSYISTVSADERRNRAQALLAFPLLRPLLLTPAYDSVRQAIDTGHSLIDTLADKWDTPKGMVRVLRGVDPCNLGLLIRELTTLIRLLREIPADWWPRDAATWRLFSKATEVIGKVSKRPITTPANQLWLRESARHGYEVGDKTTEEFARIGEEIHDLLDMLIRALGWTQAEARRSRPGQIFPPPQETAASLRAGLGLEKLCLLARRFGDAYRRAVEAYAQEAELWNGVRWPVIGSAEPRHYNGVLVYPLQNPADLREEGNRMSNCVAGYVGECMRGKSQIWSLRLENDKPLSTLETRTRTTSDGKRFLQVNQHKGISNQAPPPVAVRALKDFLADIHAQPDVMNDYLAWCQKVMRRPLSERQQYALMQPIITALQNTLPKRWAWNRIVNESLSEKIEISESH